MMHMPAEELPTGLLPADAALVQLPADAVPKPQADEALTEPLEELLMELKEEVQTEPAEELLTEPAKEEIQIEEAATEEAPQELPRE